MDISSLLGKISLMNLFTAVTTIFSLIFGYLYFRGASKRSTYDFIESQIHSLLKLQIDYPDFRNEQYFNEIKSKDGAPKSKDLLRYEAYCCLVWNTLETLFEKYGKRALQKSSFLPAMRTMAKRHKAWLIENNLLGSFNIKMIAFLIEDKTI